MNLFMYFSFSVHKSVLKVFIIDHLGMVRSVKVQAVRRVECEKRRREGLEEELAKARETIRRLEEELFQLKNSTKKLEE